MSQVPISVDPAAINEYIAKQIIDSVLGERLKEVVDDAIKAFGKYGSDPLKGAVQSEITKQVQEMVRTEFSPQIEAAVREAMTPEFIQNLVSSFIQSITVQLERRF